MNRSTIDDVVENLLYVLPLIHKKLLKIEPPADKPKLTLSRIHVSIMGMIRDDGPLPISEIARRLLIPKPQMTHLINNLVNHGMVAKQVSSEDRRVVNISLTSAGETTIRRLDEILKMNVRKNLSYLSDAELEELSVVLAKLRELGTKLETGRKQA